jgi:hypothetical protein
MARDDGGLRPIDAPLTWGDEDGVPTVSGDACCDECWECYADHDRPSAHKVNALGLDWDGEYRILCDGTLARLLEEED